MAQTLVTTTDTSMWFGHDQKLREPSRIEHNGGLWTVKLQNTFQNKRGDIVAVWVIDQYMRPTPAEEARQLRRTAQNHRRSLDHLDMAMWYEEMAHRAEHEYPDNDTNRTFHGIGAW